MWICPNCHKENQDEGAFCSFCGEKVLPVSVKPSTVDQGHVCPGCGSWMRSGEDTCHVCGMQSSPTREPEEEPLFDTKEEPQGDTVRRILPWLIGLVTLLIIALVILLCVRSCNPGKKPSQDGATPPVQVEAVRPTEAPAPTQAPAPTEAPTPAPTEAPTPAPTATPVPTPTATPYSNYFTFGGEEWIKGADSISVKGKSGQEILITASEMQDLVTYCPDIEELELDYCYMYDYSPIGELTNLRKLQLSSCNGHKVDDISFLTDLTELTELNLCYNNIEHLSPIVGLKKLTWLNLGQNPLNSTALIRISKLTNLRTLFLYSTGIENLYGLEKLTKLTQLNVRNNPKVQMLHGTNLPSGKKDYYTLNYIVHKLPNLKVLQLTGTKVEDFSCLYGTTIDTLWIDNLKSYDDFAYYDYSDLAAMPKLKTVYIGKNDKFIDEAMLQAQLPSVKIKKS